MARTVCVKPCASDLPLPQLKVPLMGSAMKAQGNLSVQGGCDGCELAGNFLMQISPLIGSFGLPLCLLGCTNALVAFAQAIPDSLGPPPDPSVLISRVSDVVTKCKCVVSIVLPPPVGIVCDFLVMVRDIINLFATTVNCLVGLVTHLASFSAKAGALLASPSAASRATGLCLVDQGQAMTDQLGQKLGSLGALLEVLDPIFTLLADVVPAPFDDTVNDFKNGFAVLSGSTPPGTAPGDFLEALTTFNEVLQTMAVTFSTIVSVCPGA